MSTYTWFGSVASRWPVIPVRRVAKLGTGHTPDRAKPEYWVRDECTIPWVTVADIQTLPGTGLQPLTETEQHISQVGLANSAAVLHPSDTVMLSRTASIGHCCRIGRPMATTQAFVTWTPGPLVDARYLLLAAKALRPELDRLAYGSTHLTIYMPDIESIKMPLPPKPQQRAIADYLDAETARIDALIEKKRRIINLLVERRMAVMTEGVEGRFTSDSPEESSLPWLEERGRSWREVKLTLAAKLGSGHTPSREHPEWWENPTIPWITTGEVAQIRSDRIEYIVETREKISELGVANSAAEVHPAETVVLCRTASAGYSAIMGRAMATSQDFATWTCGPLLRPRFLLLCLRAMRQDLLGRLAMGSTHKTIYMPDIESLRVPLPHMDEQDEIVDAVWTRLRQIDVAADRLMEQVELLGEHRQALITAAVTGQLDIHGLAA